MGSMFSLVPGEEVVLFKRVGKEATIRLVTFDQKNDRGWVFFSHLENCRIAFSPSQMRTVFFVRKWI